MPADDPEHCPRLDLLWLSGGQWYASIIHSEVEYESFLQTAREMKAVAAVSLN